MLKLKRFLVQSFLLIAVSVSAADAPQSVAVTLLHVNDIHGHTEPHRKDAQLLGGYARLSTLVTKLREESQAVRVFLIHAGDEFSRGDALTQNSRGAANIELMNFLKFDLWTPGNGEFYSGVPNLQARIKEAHFPTLTANVTLTATGEPLGKEYVIEQAGPVKIAFFGLCFVRTPLLAPNTLDVADALATAQKLVPKLRKQADIVVAVDHLGLEADAILAQAVDGIDLIIGGHSHEFLKEGRRVKDLAGHEVLICQAGEYLEALGRVDLLLEKPQGAERWEIRKATAKLLPLDEKVPLDPAVTALIARLNERYPTPPAKAPAKTPANAH